MDLEHLQRRHWALIGLAVGLLFAASKAFLGGDYDGHSLDRNFDVFAFGSREAPVPVGFFFTSKQWCYLSEVVVHPPVPANPKTDPGDASPAGTPIYWVTGKLHEMKVSGKRGGPGKTMFEEAAVSEFFHRGPAPYKANGKSYPTVMAFLDDVAKQSDKRGGHYRFAWWDKPAAVWTIYPAAGVLLIGGVWPTLLQLLAGMGLGRRRDPSEPAFDLKAYKPSPTTTPTAPDRSLTAEEQRQLDVMTAAMEADLLSGPPVPQPVAVTAAPPTVRDLDAPALSPERPAPVPQPKAFDGDYYPTEVHKPSTDHDS